VSGATRRKQEMIPRGRLPTSDFLAPCQHAMCETLSQADLRVPSEWLVDAYIFATTKFSALTANVPGFAWMLLSGAAGQVILGWLWRSGRSAWERRNAARRSRRVAAAATARRNATRRGTGGSWGIGAVGGEQSERCRGVKSTVDDGSAGPQMKCAGSVEPSGGGDRRWR
jgi:hypothetical protein